MVNVRVFVNNISAENFWEIGKTIPPVQIATNLNVVGINKKDEDMLEVPFVFTINYSPAVAQISLKGKSHVTGPKDELEQILKDHKEKKPSAAYCHAVYIKHCFLRVSNCMSKPKHSAANTSTKNSYWAHRRNDLNQHTEPNPATLLLSLLDFPEKILFSTCTSIRLLICYFIGCISDKLHTYTLSFWLFLLLSN